MSPKQFRQQYLGQRIEKILKDFHIPATRLQIEITEIAYFDNPQLAARQIRDISKRKVRFILDDCGAAGNAIYNLSKLPDDIIRAQMIHAAKIDRALVSNIARKEDRIIFKHSIEMAWYFGFLVVVEGIETREQNTIIDEIEAELSQSGQKTEILRQGYFFSKPVPDREFVGYLNRGEVIPDDRDER
jgi:EAL domain-containing protein (putative c-di-GMP-specific phosphodiesterase class I)